MLGIIGGSGFYSMEGLEGLEAHNVGTPFGNPSSPVMIGRIGSNPVAFMARHGEKHQFTPTEVNYRANIWALKTVGVDHAVSVSAVGSLDKNLEPSHLAIASQYIDFTKGKREPSFFGNGIVAHISTAEPTCPVLSAAINKCCIEKKLPVHTGVTYACVEGPRLGTRAESFFLRNSGAHIVGMTNVPEAFLAREAQICYTTLAVVTDYDCWLEDPEKHASVDKIIALYKENIEKVQDVLRILATRSHDSSNCNCQKSLDGAVVSSEDELSSKEKAILSFLRAKS
ncbi:MAG: S-methyl-5'-thioadenosine phosphorylase [SAR324 cluster bacterium]|uniref:Purine nucleoside phosphorylase n=1 Tax=SAR324 cluster bacterium TaxID=2024889 RepID=A0A7X9FT44_9DELT|nr:S-methyl-5'-thioadenosine phosphorylase [SAR324 cluster bacterium]